MSVSSSVAVDDVHRLRRNVLAPGLWAVAVLAWGVGDMVTTHYALATVPTAYESTPAVAAVLEVAGVAGHVGFKSFWLALGYLYYRRVPRAAEQLTETPTSVVQWVMLALPAAFASAGVWLTLTNLDVILSG